MSSRWKTATEVLRAEYLYREENRRRDLINSIRNRTMTQASYLQTTHALRRFMWNRKRNVFEADLQF